MILYDSSQWPLVVIHFRSSEWTKHDYQSFMLAFQGLLDKSYLEQTRIKLFIQGSQECNVPPLRLYKWIIKDIVQMYGRLKDTVNKTAIYTPDHRLDTFFEMLFKVYTPSRPLIRTSNYNKARRWLLSDQT